MQLLRLPLALAALTITLTSAQNPTTLTPADATPLAPMPSTSDNASQNQNGTPNSASLYSYYLIFIALIVCVAGVAAFLTYKRRKKLGLAMQQNRQSALQRDLNDWNPARARRRYWQGRWRSADVDHEEGLNENGEAPPPYVPKTREEETGGVAVPMQTLSREQAGLKPPDYAEVGTSAVGEGGAASSGSTADGSHQQRGGT